MSAASTILGMGKKKHADPAKPPAKKPNRSPSWVVYCRVDPDLEAQVNKFIALQELKPTLGRIVERALKMYLESKDLWPPEEDE